MIQPLTFFAPPARFGAEELVRQNTLLARDEGLRTLIDAMPELVMIVGSTRQIVLGNRALTGFAVANGRGEYIGMRPGELLACQHALSAPAGCGTGEACRTCGAVEAILAALAGDRACHECRVTRRASHGIEALDLKVWGTPLRWGGEMLALVVAVDISDTKRRQVLERIFFHDLLNTAGAISGLVQLLVEGIMPIDEAKERLEETARTLVSEIRSQRELLAAENNELSVRPEAIHSRLFLDAVARTYRTTSLGRGHQIIIAPGSDERIFYSDERLLGRVVGNLVKNALEASQEGGDITLGCGVTGELISFWCHNAGVMPREIQLQIFNRSFSTKGSGRGIGTYSVKLLTERYLKGEVTFVSSAECGTLFTVTCPLDFRSFCSPASA